MRWSFRATLSGALLAGLFGFGHRALAFPASDVTSPSIVQPATGAEPDAADAAALAHQAQLLGSYSQSVGTGWNITPSLGVQEIFNDNVLQSSSHRQWDLVSYLTPGLAIYGDTPNAQVRVNYQPSLIDYIHESSLNQVAQSLNATGDFTVLQDHLYVDVRGIAGIGSTNGSAPGLGYGATSNGAGGTSNLSGATLTKQNSTQYTSFEVSPYVLQSFGDYGTLKVGYTLNQSTSSNGMGNVAPTTGTNGSSTQVTNEELIDYTTGQYFDRLSDTAEADARQFSGTGGTAGGHNNTATNTVTYILNRTYAVFGSIGYEDITYSGTNPLAIHDITWSVGTTVTPNPDSTATLRYGHADGVDDMSFTARYALTARTTIFSSYTTELGTQLQQVQNQLENSEVNNQGSLVNGKTGATQSVGNNLLGNQNQIFRSNTFSIGSTTVRERDVVTINAQYTEYTYVGAGAAGGTSGITGTMGWIHQIRDDLTLNNSVSYGRRWSASPLGHSIYIAMLSSLTYNFSATLSGSVSYEFYDVNASGSGASMYQDLFIVSLNKSF